MYKKGISFLAAVLFLAVPCFGADEYHGYRNEYPASGVYANSNNYSDNRYDTRVALSYPNGRQGGFAGVDDATSTDTGDLYITREQLERILSSGEYAIPQAKQPSSPWSKNGFTITPYGYINLSTSYETSRTVNGDFALYSQSPDLDGGGHSGFHIDPKSTRLGLEVKAPQFLFCGEKVDTTALAEVDFQGSNYAGTRNRGSLMLRRAVVDFKCKNSRFLIGQEWDIVSPLVPQSLNYVPGSYTGNLGYRRAQIRFDNTQKWSGDFNTIWQLAVCDNVPSDFLTDPTIIKANSGWPLFQGRVAASFGRYRCEKCDPITVGFSGHIGELAHDYKRNDLWRRERHETWSLNLDLDVPITKSFRFSTELYTGKNLATMLAGIGQGVDLYDSEGNFDPSSAGAYGGWMNLNWKVNRKYQMNAGYCIERMDGITAHTSIGGNRYVARDKNQVVFLNGIYNWTDNFFTGLEVSQWQTDWHGFDSANKTKFDLETGRTTRIEVLARYTF